MNQLRFAPRTRESRLQSSVDVNELYIFYNTLTILNAFSSDISFHQG